MKAIILAGGRGERLKPLTNKIPKPMIKVKGKPILEHVLNLFKKNGINEYIFALCYLPEFITSYFKDGSRFGVNIVYTYENKFSPLGTAGAIISAKDMVNGTFIVTYADILRDLEIKDMIKQHQNNDVISTIHTYKRYGKNPKSKIIFDKGKYILEFNERPDDEISNDSFVWANGSFYIFDPKIFDFIPQSIPSDFGKDIFPKVLASGEKILAYPCTNYFIDVGTPQKLTKARMTFKM